jgi:hypothetical protein
MEQFPYHYSRQARPEESADSSLKSMIDELQRMVALLSERIEDRCGGLEDRVERSEQHAEERIISLEMARTELESGRADLTKHVEDLQLKVNRVNHFFEREHMEHQTSKVGIFPTALRHDLDSLSSQDLGTSRVPPSSLHVYFASESCHGRAIGSSGEFGRSGQGRLLKLNFLSFSSDDPQLWRSRCESYFEMYGMEYSLWIKVASMHFEGAAARWFQSHEKCVRDIPWDSFCAMVHERFGRDQHEALIRQLFHIKQLGSVSEYVEQFSTPVDQLVAYESDANPLYYAMWFVDGVKEDIRKVVMIQRPGSLDSACALALVQEEANESTKKKEYIRFEPSAYRGSYKSVSNLAGPPKFDKYDDKKNLDQQKLESFEDKSNTVEPGDCVILVLKSGLMAISVLHRFSYMWCTRCGNCCQRRIQCLILQWLLKVLMILVRCICVCLRLHMMGWSLLSLCIWLLIFRVYL